MGILIGEAVRKTAAAKGVSLGQAKMELIGACEAGTIRAIWSSYYLGTCPLIPRQEFSGADIDLEKDVLILNSGERKRGVGLDEADFVAWMTVPKAKATADSSSPDRSEGGHKAKLARKAALDLWGPAGPPKELTPQQVFKKIADHIGRKVTISKSQALRAIKLKKA